MTKITRFSLTDSLPPEERKGATLFKAAHFRIKKDKK